MKQNQLHFGQSEHKSTPFTTESTEQKCDWNASIDKAEEVLKGTYDNDGYAELTEIMKLILTDCVQISPLEKTSPEITVEQLTGKIKVWR